MRFWLVLVEILDANGKYIQEETELVGASLSLAKATEIAKKEPSRDRPNVVRVVEFNSREIEIVPFHKIRSGNGK